MNYPLLAVSITILITLVTAMWRLGSVLGSLETQIKKLSEDIVTARQHAHEHDMWHMTRGDR